MSARVPVLPAEAQRRLRAARKRLPLSDGVKGPTPPKRPFQPPLKAAADLEALNASGWLDAEPRHLVALYAWLHERVYGVRPEELVGDPLAWLGAVSAATKLLREEFDDDVVGSVKWIQWVWVREERAERRARGLAEAREFRISWRYMFCRRALLTDYRRAIASAKERAR